MKFMKEELAACGSSLDHLMLAIFAMRSCDASWLWLRQLLCKPASFSFKLRIVCEIDARHVLVSRCCVTPSRVWH